MPRVCLQFVIVVFPDQTHLLFFILNLSYNNQADVFEAFNSDSSDTEAPILDLDLSITNGIVSSKIYDKRDEFNFVIVNFSFLGGDIPRSPSYDDYISQLIRFARVCSNVDDFNNRNIFLTSYLLKQCYRYHKLRKALFLIVLRTLRAECQIQYLFKDSSATRHIRTCISW